MKFREKRAAMDRARERAENDKKAGGKTQQPPTGADDLAPPPFPDDPNVNISSNGAAPSEEETPAKQTTEQEPVTAETAEATTSETEGTGADTKSAAESTPEAAESQTPKDRPEPCAYPEVGVFFEVRSSNVKSGWTTQSVWDFIRNARLFMAKCGILGSVESYIRSEISNGGVRLAAKYLDHETHPVDKPAVPAKLAKAVISDYCRRLSVIDSNPVVTPLNVLFASLDPENASEAFDQLSEADKKAAIARMEQSMQSEWHNPYADDSPTDLPTQP